VTGELRASKVAGEKERERKEKELSFEKSAAALSLSTTGPGDILSRVYLRGAGVINHGFVCLRESSRPGTDVHVYMYTRTDRNV